MTSRRKQPLKNLVAIVLLSLGLAGCALFAPFRAGPITTEINHAALAAREISAYRAQHGLAAVEVDWSLMRAAEEQARAVAAMDGLSHDAAGRFDRRMSRHGVNGAAAENLGAGAASPERAIERWRASPSHDENLRMPEARRIGFVKAYAPETRYKNFWVLVLAD